MTKQYYLTRTDLHDKLPLFFRPWWLTMTSGNWDIAVIKNDDGLTGLWPYCMEQKAGIRLIRNPSVTPYLGPLVLQQDNIIFSDEHSGHDDLLKALLASLPRHGSLDAETTIHFNNQKFFIERGYKVVPKLTYELSLELDSDLIFKGFHHNHRKLIRLAKECHTVEEGLKYQDAFFPLHEKTYTRKGKRYHYNKAYLNKIITTSIDQNAGQLFTAIDADGRPAAFLFTAWDHQRMYLLLSAVDTAIAHNGAGRLLIWHTIQLAKQMGLAVFDFEGSMDERVGNIYKRFGGTQKTYLCISRTDAWLWKLKQRLLG